MKAGMLQRVFRGNKSRRRVRMLRITWRLQRAFLAEVSLMLQRIARGFLGRQLFIRVHDIKHAAALEIQRVLRGFRAKERFKLRRYLRLRWAAINIQRVHRGYVGEHL